MTRVIFKQWGFPVLTGVIIAILGLASNFATAGLEEMIIVSGKVLRDDVPVPEAQVYIHNRDTGTKLESVTQADGSFRFEIPKLDDIRWCALMVIAQHPQHSFGWTEVS